VRRFLILTCLVTLSVPAFADIDLNEDFSKVFVSAGYNFKTRQGSFDFLDANGELLKIGNQKLHLGGDYVPPTTLDFNFKDNISGDPQYFNLTLNNFKLFTISGFENAGIGQLARLFQGGVKAYDVSYGFRVPLFGQPYKGGPDKREASSDEKCRSIFPLLNFCQAALEGTFKSDDAERNSMSGRLSIDLSLRAGLHTTPRNKALNRSCFRARRGLYFIGPDDIAVAREFRSTWVSELTSQGQIQPSNQSELYQLLGIKGIARLEAAVATPYRIHTIDDLILSRPTLDRFLTHVPFDSARQDLLRRGSTGSGSPGDVLTALQKRYENAINRIWVALRRLGFVDPDNAGQSVGGSSVKAFMDMLPAYHATDGTSSTDSSKETPLLFMLAAAASAPSARSERSADTNNERRILIGLSNALNSALEASADSLALLNRSYPPPPAGATRRRAEDNDELVRAVEYCLFPTFNLARQFDPLERAARQVWRSLAEKVDVMQYLADVPPKPQPDRKWSVYLQALGWQRFTGERGPQGYLNARLVYHLPHAETTGNGIALSYVVGNIPADVNNGVSRLTLDAIFHFR